MSRRRVVAIDPRVLGALIDDALLWHPLETGGVLLGRPTPSGEPHIVELIGPGPDARRTPTTFDPDTDWQQDQLDAAFAATPGLSYLGDWHSHPNGVPRPSGLDQRAARAIGDDPLALQAEPLMLIVGVGADGRIDPRCFWLRGRTLRPVRLELRRSDPPSDAGSSSAAESSGDAGP